MWQFFFTTSYDDQKNGDASQVIHCRVDHQLLDCGFILLFDNHHLDQTTQPLTNMSSFKYPWIHEAAKMAHKSLCQLKPDTLWNIHDIQQWIQDSYTMTQSDRRKIYHTAQRTKDWFRFRDGETKLKGQVDEQDATQRVQKTIIRAPIITSSIAGKILGHEDGYKRDRFKICREMLWSELKPNFTPIVQGMLDRGTACEKITMDYTIMHLYEHYRQEYPRIQIWITEVGLVVDPNYPFMAASPDGIVHFYDPDQNLYWQSGLEMKCRGMAYLDPYPTIPHKYLDQIQHAMAIIGLKDYHFVVYANHLIQFEVYQFDAMQWHKAMEQFKEYYWKHLWPAVVLKAHGWLTCPDYRPSIDVTCASLLIDPIIRQAYDDWKRENVDVMQDSDNPDDPRFHAIKRSKLCEAEEELS